MFCSCVAIWLYICVVDDASKLEMSTQPQLNVLPHAYLMLGGGGDCSACLSCGMVVLLIMTGCRLFHKMLMVLGKKDDLNTCVRA